MATKNSKVKHIQKLLLFLLFPAALIIAAFFLLRPSGDAKARDAIRGATSTMLKAESLAKETNDQQDLHNVQRARDELDRAKTLKIESDYDASMAASEKSVGYSKLVIERRKQSDTFVAAVRFDEMIGEVMFRRSNDTDYRSASKKTVLGAGDVVKTSPKSSCRLVFQDGMVTVIGPSSLITIKDAYESRESQENFVNLRLETGELTLKSSELAANAKPNVLTKSGSAMVYHSSQVAVAYSALRTQTELSVYQGRATAASGSRSIDITENQRVVLGDDQSIGDLVELPPAPKLLRPDNFSKIEEGEDQTASVILGWTAVDPTASYHVELSPNILFTEWIHEDERYFRNQVEYPNLPPGVYFWRVASIDADSVEGAPSDVWQFQIGQELLSSAKAVDTKPPSLKIHDISVHGYLVIITGQSEKTSTVRVDGQKAILDINSGNFSYTAEMRKKGVHSIHVIAEDPAGNRSHKEIEVEIKE